MAIAKIENYHGEPAVIIDGMAYPPMTVTLNLRDPEYLKRLRESGIRVFYLETTTRWNNPGDEKTPDGITKTLRDMKLLLDAVPDAYIMLRLNVSPNVKWINEHPEEQVQFNDGKRKPVICTSAGREPVDGMVSFASEKWKEDGAKALEEYFDEIDGNPMFERVIGYFLCAGGTGEWYYPGETRMHDDKTGDYADFSEPFRRSFGRFLRKKYGTEEELRRVWQRPDASFEHPIIPNTVTHSGWIRWFTTGQKQNIPRREAI